MDGGWKGELALEGIKQEAGGKKGQWREYRERQLKLRAVGGVIWKPNAIEAS